MYMQKHFSEGVLWKRCSKKILQNSQKNIYAEVSFLIELEASILKLYWKRIQRRCFPKTFEKALTKFFYRTSQVIAS